MQDPEVSATTKQQPEYKDKPYGIERYLAKIQGLVDAKENEKAYKILARIVKGGGYMIDKTLIARLCDITLINASKFESETDYKGCLVWVDKGIKHTEHIMTTIKDKDYGDARAVLAKLEYIRGYTLNRLGRYSEAIEVLNKSIQVMPTVSHYLEINLAHVRTRNAKAGIENLKNGIKAMKSQEDQSRLILELATMSIIDGDLKSAIDYYTELEGRGAITASMLVNKSLCLNGMGLLTETKECLERAIKLDKNMPEIYSNLGMRALYDPDLSEKEVWEEHKRAGAELYRIYGDIKAPHLNVVRNTARKIRVGYLGHQFPLGGSLCRFFIPIFTKFDDSVFEVFIIDNSFTSAEDRKLYPEHVKWVDIGEMALLKAAQLIADCNLDILIDLIGFTDRHRADIMTCRLARVQIGYAAYMYHTGSPNIDWIIGDRIQCFQDSPDTPADLVKKLIKLDCCYTHYTPSAKYEITEATPFPCKVLESGVITFGSMNKTEKMNQQVIDLWDSILDKVPNSRLVIKSSRSTLKFRNENRVVYMPIAPTYNEYLTQMARIDIALDTFPWTGTTTTCDYLVMGIPMITLIGDKFIQRSSASILVHSGLDMFVAKTKNEYLEIAVELANQVRMEANGGIKKFHIQEAFLKGDVCNTAKFMKNYEGLLKSLV